MKNQITKTVLAIALLASGFMANANDSEREISLTTEKQKAVVLQMNNIKVGTQISLIDDEGKVLFKDESKENQYGKVFNLEQLDEGQIYLEIENDESLEVMSIEVSKTEAVLNSKSQLMIEKPVVKHANGSMKIFLGDDHPNFELKVYDEFGDISFEDEIGAGENQLKRYDISKLSKGTYELQFSTDGRSFYHTITLN